MLTEDEYKKLCEATCNTYVVPNGADEARAEEDMLWLICREACGALGAEFFFPPFETKSRAELYRLSLDHWLKEEESPIIYAGNIAQRAINRRLGRPENAPALNE